LFVDQAFAKPPGHFGSVALATDGEIRPFAIAIPVSFPAAVAIFGSGRRWKARGCRIALRLGPGPPAIVRSAVTIAAWITGSGTGTWAGAWSRGRVGFIGKRR
jgi:hypothetical protein